MRPVDTLSRRDGVMLGLRMLGVGVILGPVAFGTLFTLPIYVTAVSGGENAVSQLMLFPFGWLMAIALAGMPAAILTAVLVIYRVVVGPWTTRRLAIVLLPLTWALASFFIWKMDGGQALDAETTSVAAVSGLFYAILVFCVILFFWSLRHRLGLSILSSPASRIAVKVDGHE